MKFHNKEIHAILPNWLSCVDRAGKCFFFAFMAFSCLRGGPFDFCGGRGEGGSIGLCKNFFPLASVAGDFFKAVHAHFYSHSCCTNFFFCKGFAGNFFVKSYTPLPPVKVKWSTPNTRSRQFVSQVETGFSWMSTDHRAFVRAVRQIRSIPGEFHENEPATLQTKLNSRQSQHFYKNGQRLSLFLLGGQFFPQS